MSDKKNNARKQIRLTYQDTITSQAELSRLILSKIRHNTGLSDKESQKFPKLLGDALLSQGNIPKLFYDHGHIRIPLGRAHTFALRMTKVQGPRQTIKYEDTIIQVDISELWQRLYDSFMNIFPSSIQEAIHISKEIPYKERDEGYEFSIESDLNK